VRAQPRIDIPADIRKLITIDLQRVFQHARIDRIDTQIVQLEIRDSAHRPAQRPINSASTNRVRRRLVALVLAPSFPPDLHAEQQRSKQRDQRHPSCDDRQGQGQQLGQRVASADRAGRRGDALANGLAVFEILDAGVVAHRTPNATAATPKKGRSGTRRSTLPHLRRRGGCPFFCVGGLVG
jgi:hypothetical protein